MKVQATVKKIEGKPSVSVEYPIPDTLDGFRKSFGDEVTYAAAKGATVISLQAFLRRLIEKGTPQAEIQKQAAAWKPDVRTIVKQTAFEKASSVLGKLTAEERKKLLSDLQKMQ